MPEADVGQAVAAAVAALLALIWLTGALAGLLFGSGWTAIGASDLGATALRLPSHLSEPRDAWPPDARPELPGAIGFYASLVLFGGLIAGTILALRRASLPVSLPQLGAGGRRVPTARWATLRDLGPLRVRESQPGRLTIGRHGRALLAAEENQSVIAFDPTGVSGIEPSTRATPLEGAKTWQGARKVAHWLCNSAQGSKSGLQDADFWFATAGKLLGPLLFAAATSKRTMADVVRWLDEGPDVNSAQVGKALKKAGEPAAEQAWQATQNREEKQRSSVYTTAEMVVSAFADNGRRSATIINNHRGKWFGVGIADPETLTFISRVGGVAEFEQLTRNAGERGKRSQTEGETYRDLAPAHVVRERELATALLLYHNLPLAKITLRLWFEDKGLMDLQRGASPLGAVRMPP
ncbi:MAG TPA: type IV secretory system conjugative DNA transfer family protein [Solirubrobacterales bacterium]|nr:type IV secretory system conjugative DNA transfer family protein [Solirubrobacterales bacterium]